MRGIMVDRIYIMFRGLIPLPSSGDSDYSHIFIKHDIFDVAMVVGVFLSG